MTAFGRIGGARNRNLASLSALFRWAVETEQVERDPTRHVNGLAQQPTAPQSLSDQDLTRILRQAALSGNLRDRALLELLAATGLRVSEIASLQVRDLDLGERHGWVTVRASKAKWRKERQETSEAMIYAAMIRLMLKRLARHPAVAL